MSGGTRAVDDDNNASGGSEEENEVSGAAGAGAVCPGSPLGGNDSSPDDAGSGVSSTVLNVPAS